MSKRIFDYDPATGVTDVFEYNAATDTTILHRTQDVSPIIEDNKLLQNNPDYWKAGVKKDFAHYAAIPIVIIEKWKNEHGIDVFNKNHEKRVFQMLNSPEYRFLKTTTKVHNPRVS